ncbi:uncharacterized protein LOC119680335 [Teleopsis dalmanni]|uniref:uncharacterized protein LOC119680335 n=1 Tax=Teleopsis dalmanni TaxID=139649 RepID=UPI0018CF1B8F|nr:uncharacterized protein LOC119680335 [Teleopsis dalmanni]
MSRRLGDITLVKQVEMYPCLWNSNCKSYCRADLVSRAWRRIADKLEDSVDNCRERWKHIRTAYRRSLQPSKSGFRRLKKPYFLTNHISFLFPFLKRMSKSGNILLKPAIDEENGDDTEAEVTQYSNIVQEHDETNDNYITSETQHNDNYNNFENIMVSIPKKHKRETNFSEDDRAFKDRDVEIEQTFLNEIAFKKENEVIKEEDSDSLFFRSLLIDFKKLDERRKRKMKSQFLQIINEQLEVTEMEASGRMNLCCSSTPTQNTPYEPNKIEEPLITDTLKEEYVVSPESDK